MKAKLLDKSTLQNKSFNLEFHDYPYFLKMWHYHEELEMSLIEESNGAIFIGDGISNFDCGDFILIGKNLPHLFQNDEKFFLKNPKIRAKALVTHFREDFLGKEFFQIPEMYGIRQLFDRASRGIRFYGPSIENIRSEYRSLYKKNDFERIPEIIKLLNDLSRIKDYELISSVGYLESFEKGKDSKLDKIYSYIYENFKSDINLEVVASIANMNPSAFSRYFKRMNKKTFSQFLNQVRIGYACKMLIDDNYNIAQVCYASGYNNISNFNKQFKAITDMTPSEYLEKFNFE
ncbi:MAG: helix-turn-helix domain-containing protein [Cyclobacteriaceae bacterium]